MRISSLTFRAGKWSEPFPTDLDSQKTLVLGFYSPTLTDLERQLEDVRKAFPTSIVMGCSTAGEIHGPWVHDHSISLSITRFDHTPLRFAETEVGSAADSFEAGKQIRTTLEHEDLKGIFVLSDGLKINGTQLVRGLATADRIVPISGGLAGDGDRFVSTSVLGSLGPRPGQIVAVGFYGDRIRIGAGSVGGWDTFGPPRKITRSSDNTLYELDRTPCLELYKRYLGADASRLPGSALLFPLALQSGQGILVRTVLSVDETSQSMTFAGDIPEGSTVTLMKANFNRLVEGAESAGKIASRESDPNSETLAIAISCVGRKLVLGARIDDETEALLKILPTGTHQVGFYSYGELSPLAAGHCELHNQTMTLTTIQERESARSSSSNSAT